MRLILLSAFLFALAPARAALDWPVRSDQISTLEKSGQPDQAVALAEATVHEAETISGPNSSDLVPILNELAELQLRRNAYAKAEPLLQRMVDLRKKNQGPDDPLTADALTRQAWFYENMADYPRALGLFQETLRIREKKFGRRHEAVAESLNNLGVLLENLGRFQKSEAYYLEALQLRRELLGSDNYNTATTTNNLATLYWSMGDYARAEQYYNEALRIREKTLGPLALATATSLNNLALLRLSMGDYAHAEPLFLRVLHIREKKLGPEHTFTLTTVHQLGLLYVNTGAYEKAEPLLLRAARSREKIMGPDHPDTARSLFHLAWLYDREKEYAQAEPLHLRALAVRLKKLGEHHPETAGSYSYLARHYHLQGKLDQAEPLYQKALALQTSILGPNAPDTLKTVENLACLYIDKQQPDQALACARQAIATREQMLQNLFSFTSEQQRIDFQKTLSLYNLAASLGSVPDIARVAFRTKGVVLDSLIEDQINARSSADPEVRSLLDRLQLNARQLLQSEMHTPDDTTGDGQTRQADTDKLQREAAELQEAFARKVAGSGKARRALQIDPAAIQQSLPQDAVLVEWLHYNAYEKNLQFHPAYGALVVTHDGPPRWVPLGQADEIDRMVATYQKYMHHRVSDAAVDRITSDLSARVLAPVAALFPAGTRRVILSPDSQLNFVSFAALPTPDEKFWAEKYQFSYVSSGRDLLRSFPARNTNSQIVIFAGPDYDSPAPAAVSPSNTALRQFDGIKLQSLTGASQEAQFLQARASAWGCRSLCYTGANATETALRQIQPPFILHMATHGLFLPEPDAASAHAAVIMTSPMQRSLLVLAAAQHTFDSWQKGVIPPVENDGVITAGEVGALNLNGTWLVVLSACNTGQGLAQAGEGVLGLRRGFVMAGAQNLLLTLWPVADAETVPTMEAFYDRALLTRDAADALAEVQKERLIVLKKKYGLGQAIRLAGPFILSQ